MKSMKNLASRGLSTINQGLKHNYVYKPEVYNVKRQDWNFGWEN
jgi:hypothetical protein